MEKVNWNTLPRDIKGIIISNIPFKNFVTLLQVNEEFFALTLSYIKPTNATAMFCKNVYSFIFNFLNYCSSKSIPTKKKFNLILIIEHFLSNKHISPLHLLKATKGYSSKSNKCVLVNMYTILFKRIDADDALKKQKKTIELILKLNKEKIMECMFHRNEYEQLKIDPMLQIIKITSKYIEKWITELI